MSSQAEQGEDFSRSLSEIARRDGRYDVRAFQFLMEALSYTQDIFEKNLDSRIESERHVTGQQLCEGIRQYALEQFGYIAKAVLEEWGIYRTDDFGEMVYLLIQHHIMAKCDSDSIEDFHNVYDFDRAFEDVFTVEDPTRNRARRRP